MDHEREAELDDKTRRSRWSLRAVATIVLVILLVGIPQLFAWHSLSRQRLGIAVSDAAREQAACEDGHIPIQHEFNAQQGAHDYLPYAVAAADVYGMDGRNDAAEFTLDRYGDEWANTKKPRVMTFNEGFLATDLTVDHYARDRGNRLIVLVAFRGTFSSRDWLSNASWFLRWLPIPNHYDDARRAFEKIRADALNEANGRPVNFVVTGHSLGGGLAMHIAYGYPCVSAVVFNASPVINRHLYEAPFYGAKIAHIFQNCEVLGLARRLVGGDKPFPFLAWIQNLFGGEYISTNYHYYNYDAQNSSKEEHEMNCFQRLFFTGAPKVRRLHNMDNYVQGLSRTAVTCESDDYRNQTKICSFHEFDAARRIYCIPRKQQEHDPPCLCRNWPSERRARDICFAD